MTKLHDLRDLSVAFMPCIIECCARESSRPHMHCPCGCVSITLRSIPVAHTCENCGKPCFNTHYDRATNLQICYSCQVKARAARATHGNK